MNEMPRYRFEEDGPFLPKDIYSEELRCTGLVPVTKVTATTTVTAAVTISRCWLDTGSKINTHKNSYKSHSNQP